MTLRVGLIGAGEMGRVHVERIVTELSGAQITAIADLNLDAAKEVAEPLGAKVYGSGAELIADPNVDAVMIATFGKAHKIDLLTAIRAGKYIFCEKPMVTIAADAIEVMEAEEAAGKKLVTVGFMRRFDKGYQEMRKKLESGDLGYATLLHCHHRNPTVPPAQYDSSNLIDGTAIHEFDISRYLLGEEIVSARVDLARHSSYAAANLTDPLVVVLYSESGVRIDDEVNVNIGFGYSIECELVMEQGTIRLGDQEHTYTRDKCGDRNAICSSHVDRFHDAFNTEIQAWINAVSRDEHTGSDAWDGYAATCIVDAALASQAKGGEVCDVKMIEKPALYA